MMANQFYSIYCRYHPLSMSETSTSSAIVCNVWRKSCPIFTKYIHLISYGSAHTYRLYIYQINVFIICNTIYWIKCIPLFWVGLAFPWYCNTNNTCKCTDTRFNIKAIKHKQQQYITRRMFNFKKIFKYICKLSWFDRKHFCFYYALVKWNITWQKKNKWTNFWNIH